MGGRNKNWHRRWRREGANLVHDSGLIMAPGGSAPGATWHADAAALQAWRTAQRAGGQHSERDIDAHLQRLMREAELYRDR
jgi:hypothetical protein